MALIKCTECGHEVSDKASMCPNCGCPIESLGAAQEEVIYEEPKKKKGWIWALIVALLCLIGGGGYYACVHTLPHPVSVRRSGIYAPVRSDRTPYGCSRPGSCRPHIP